MNNRGTEKEYHFFLKKNKKSIYCSEYLPQSTLDKKHAIILCKSIWGERIRTSRIFVNLARLLSKQGFTVITCDYFGDGNSEGDTLDLCFQDMVGNVYELHRYVSKKHKIETFSLVGFRVGANCAVNAEKFLRPNLEKMVLIEPIMDLNEYLKTKLRSNLSNQMVIYKKIVKNREVLINEIKRGTPVNIDGSLIGKRLWESFESVSPLSVDSEFDRDVLIISLSPKRRAKENYEGLVDRYKNGRLEVLKQEFSWDNWKKNVPKPSIFLKRLTDEFKTVANT